MHNRKGNCTEDLYSCILGCARLGVCDICHEHDEPRGECTQCPECRGCLGELADHIDVMGDVPLGG